jgi:uncharacterized protein (TIGR03663 family)
MALKCPKCGEDNPKNNRFCDSCGTKLAAAEPERKEALARRPAPPAAAKAAEASGPGFLTGVNSDLVWLLVIVAFGAFLRLWALGEKPLHHDESIHAWYSFKLFTSGGNEYKYDPAYHGPFLYHANAIMYFIFGTSDFACRLLPAIFGIGIIAFMGAWKGLLGRKGSLIAAFLIAISPTFSYVSRFIRDDIYMALGTLAMVWGLFRWFDEKQDKYLYWATAGFIVSFTSMEATWIFAGILGSFLLARWLWEALEKPGEGEEHVHQLISYLVPRCDRATGLGLAGSAAALLGGLALYTLVSHALGMSPVLSAFQGLAFVGGLGLLFFMGRYIWVTRNWTLLTMALIFMVPFTVLFSTMFFNADGWFAGAFDSLAYWLGEQKTGRADQPWFFYLGLLALYEMGIVAFATLGGLRIYFGFGKPQLFLIKLAGLAPMVVSFYLLTSNPKDPLTLLLMAGLATLGITIISFCAFEPGRENSFKVFLLHWAFLSTAMFSLAGERMPWLTLHPLTPMVLLAAVFLGELFDREEPLRFEHWIAWALVAVPVVFLLVLTPVQILYALKQAPGELASWFNSLLAHDRHGSVVPSGWHVNLWSGPFNLDGQILVWLPAILSLLPMAFAPFILQRYPALKAHTRKVWLALLILAAASLLHGTSNLLFYGSGANPAEQMIYVQSSTEITRMRERLVAMSNTLTGGMDMPVSVEDTCSWPLSWYLRDFTKQVVGYHPPLTLDQIKPPQAPNQPWPMAEYPPVVITAFDNNPPQAPNHDDTVAASLSGYYSPNRIKLRVWWGPNRDAVLGDGVSFGEMMGKFARLYLYREPWPAPNQGKDNFGNVTPIGSYDMCLWLRKDVEKYYW